MKVHRAVFCCALACALFVVVTAGIVRAELVGFDTFTAETYAPADGFAAPDWQFADLVAGGGDALVAGELGNSWPTIFYNDSSILDQRMKYLYEPGNDDDLTGLVLGFNPGDTTDATAGFLVIDWKRVEQNFDFDDPPEAPAVNNLTGASTAPASLRASWVQGVPTSDELWGKENQVGNEFGGVTLITDAATLGSTGYSQDQSYVFEVEYSASNVRLLVDGVEEFNIAPGDIPGGPASFPDGRFGLYEAYQSPGSRWSQLDIRPLTEASAADPSPLPAPEPVILSGGVKAAAIDTSDSSAWTVVASTGGASGAYVLTAPNRGDAEVGFGTDPSDPRVLLGLVNSPAVVPLPTDGIMMATVRENGPRGDQFVTVEAPADHTGWGNSRAGLATAEAPSRGEGNGNVAVAFFPYQDGWIGGWVAPDGAVSAGSGGASVTQLAPPAPSSQNGLYNVVVDGADSSSDGLLFVVGSSNENNLAAATPLADGSWNVSVRDNSMPGFTGPDEFEADDFNFVYLPLNTINLVGGLVDGFDNTTMDAQLALESGEFALVKEATGQYRLTIPGQTPDDGILMLTSTEPTALSDATIAPLNHYLTYEADGGDFLIEVRQTGADAAPALVDGGFAFAYVSFANPIQAIPEPSTAILACLGACLLVWTRRRS